MNENPLDIERHDDLIQYLRTRGHIGPDEEPTSRMLTGGVSNRTVLVERLNGDAWVIKQALAKLRVQVDWFSDPSRVHREAAGIRWLGRILPPEQIPQPIFEDRDEHIIGMSAVPQPHENWKELLLAGQVTLDHVEQFGRLLGQIHRGGTEMQADVAKEFADDSFFEALRLEPYYAFAASQVPSAADFLHRIIAETRQHKLTLVHGDFSPKNILVHKGKLVLLDHEVIHFGDPAFDLGFSMTHLLGKAHHVKEYRHTFADAVHTYWRTYQETLGDVAWAGAVEGRAVRNTLACLLARVAGRSPFEYLDAAERAKQQEVVVALMADPPSKVAALVDEFVARL